MTKTNNTRLEDLRGQIDKVCQESKTVNEKLLTLMDQMATSMNYAKGKAINDGGMWEAGHQVSRPAPGEGRLSAARRDGGPLPYQGWRPTQGEGGRSLRMICLTYELREEHHEERDNR